MKTKIGMRSGDLRSRFTETTGLSMASSSRTRQSRSDVETESMEGGIGIGSDSQSTSHRGSILSGLSRAMKRYWFVAVPAIMLNIGLTLDNVIATNNENAFRVSIKSTALEALAASKAQDEEPLSDTLRAHWITTNDEGNLTGRISAIEPSQSVTVPIEQLNVSLLKKGEKIRTSTTDDDGKFLLEDVQPGVYTLVASGQNGFLAYGVNVLPKLELFDALEKNTQLDPREKKAFYVSHFKLPQDAVIAEELQIDAAAVPPEFSTLQRISRNYLPSATALNIGRDLNDAKAISKATDIKGGFKYPLTDDGKLEGRIQPIATDDGKPAKLSDMNIFLIQDDVEAARVTVEENGKFEIEDIEPGVYSLIAAGEDGFAALSLELVKAEDKVGSRSGGTKAHYVSTGAVKNRKGPGLGIAIVSDPEDILACKREAQNAFDLRQQLNNAPGNQFANQPQVNQFANPGQMGPGGNIMQAPTGIVQSGFPVGSMPPPSYVGGSYSSGFPGGGFQGGGGGGFGGPSFGGGATPQPNFGGSRGFGAGAPRGNAGTIASLALLAVGISNIASNGDEVGSGEPPQAISTSSRF